MKRRLLAVAITSLLPALGILAYNEWSVRQSRLEEVSRQAMEASRQTATEMERILDGVEGVLTAASAIPAVNSGDPVPCGETLKALAAKVAFVQTIALIDTHGRLVCDSRTNPPGLDLSDRSYFKLVMETGTRALGDYTQSRLSGKAVLPVAIPVNTSDGNRTGVLVAGIKLDWLGDRLREPGLQKGNAYTVADRNGVIIAREPFAEKFIGGRIPDEYKDFVYAPQAGVRDVMSRDGTERILGFQPVSAPPVGLYISVGISKDEALAALNRLTYAGILLIAAGVAIAFSGAWIVGNIFIRRPIRHIVESLRAWGAGNTAVRTGMTAQAGEIEVVGETIDHLLDELAKRLQAQEAAEQRRDLVLREMAHRIKNTLGIVNAFAHQSFRGDTSGGLEVFGKRIASLSGAYDLLLTQESESADLIATIDGALKPFQERDADRMVISGETATIPPQGVIALSLVLHELATNASKYGALSVDSGRVTVDCLRGDDAQIFIRWTEMNGPQPNSDRRSGFGTRLIRGAFPASYFPHVEQIFDPTGLRCQISFHIPAEAADITGV